MSPSPPPSPPISHCPTLPPEIWITIFSHHPSPAHLWTTCRLVSPILRACADHAFAAHFLRFVSIDFQLEKYNLGGKTKRPCVPVTFDGIGDDKHVAWFRDARPRSAVCDGGAEEDDVVMKRWDASVRESAPSMPHYTIAIDGLVNDTALPGLKLDVAARQVRVEWKPMLTLFYREHAALLARKAKVDAASWPQIEPEARRQIRRARLKEAYAGHAQLLWAIESLRYFDSSAGSRDVKLNLDVPGAGLGEKWFGGLNVVQEMYLDEWSCMHRIDMKAEHLLSVLDHGNAE